jgi:hypothetical protein
MSLCRFGTQDHPALFCIKLYGRPAKALTGEIVCNDSGNTKEKDRMSTSVLMAPSAAVRIW